MYDLVYYIPLMLCNILTHNEVADQDAPLDERAAHVQHYRDRNSVFANPELSQLKGY